jgi:hypothetical protein
MNFIKLLFTIIRVLFSYYLDKIYNYWPTRFPGIRQVLIGKITVGMKGVFAIPPNANERIKAEIDHTNKIIMDNLQDGAVLWV